MIGFFVGLAWALPIAPEVCNGLDDDLNGQIDETGCDPCTRLDDGSGSSWLVCEGPFADRTAAQDFCVTSGYDLVDVGSAAEQALVETGLLPGTSYWHSVNDLAAEGVYVDSTGAPIPFTNWDVTFLPDPQPNGVTTENCATFFSGSAVPWAWHDADCAFDLGGAVCEAECTLITVYEDEDEDGFGVGPPVSICGPAPVGTALVDGDCDDTRSSVNPDENERCNSRDDDCDGDEDEGFPDLDGDGFLDCHGDCDDNDPSVFPGATETCDLRDEDCDGTVDEGLDGDGDGFTVCNGDCDDTDPDRWPGAAEIDDGVDDDCDGIAAEGPTYYADLDGDGFGDPATENPVQFPGSVTTGGDCSDLSALVFPGAPEVCNGIDDNCTGWADEGSVCTDCRPFDTPSGPVLRCTFSERWYEAVEECRQMGWELASATDAAQEQDQMRVAATVSQRDWWTGVNDIGEEDVLVDVGGAPAYAGYSSGQPNDDSEGQECVALVRRPWEVHDRDCSSSYSFLCEPCPSQAWFLDADGDGSGAGDPVFACERPDGAFVKFGGDCDDADPGVRSGVAEVCDGVDNDCDGTIDQGPVLQLVDSDGDGFGSAESAVLVASCAGNDVPPGDCDDSDSAVSAGAIEACNGIDDDCDGFVDEGACACEVVQVGTQILQLCPVATELTWDAARTECLDDGYDLVTPSTPDEWRVTVTELYSRTSTNNGYWLGFVDAGLGWEWVDGSVWSYERFANDQPSGNGVCGHIYEGGAHTRWNDYPCDNTEDWICEAECNAVTLYRDADGDGDGDPSISRVACGPVLGWVTSASDCEDGQPLANSRFDEICDGLDNDCNGTVDDNLPLTDWYVDLDGDGVGSAILQGCLQPPGTVTFGGDCDDADPFTYPGASELCDGFDQDCDGSIDEDAVDASPGYIDGDGDGYGPDSTLGAWCIGSLPAGYTPDGGDCNDALPAISPGADEVCGGADDDCDGLIDDEDPSLDPASTQSWYPDGDGDGYGDMVPSIAEQCSQPAGAAPTDDDCDDVDPASYPGAIDIPGDGIDQNCNGVDTAIDADTDADGLLDVDEIALGSSPISNDTDGDGVRDGDEVDPGPTNRDTDGDGLPDHSDDDDDGDGVPTKDERTTDSDGDGLPDYRDTDSDDDGALDGSEGTGDRDSDGLIDRLDPGGIAVRQPPRAEPGCGCSTGGLPGGVGVWLFALVAYRRSRMRAWRASSRRA